MYSDDGGGPAAVQDLAGRFGQRAVEFTASGSAALEIALELLDIGHGDEVIVPDIGCHSVAAAVVRRGAVPVFVSVGEALTLSPNDVSVAVDRRTRAIVAVHQYGLPCDVQALVDFLPPEIVVVEDVAQAWGSCTRGARVGSIGVFAAASFGPTKPISLGGGGALLGSPEALSGAISRGDIRDRLLRRPPSPARLPVQLLDQLPIALELADQRLAARRAVVEAFLNSELSNFFQTPPTPPDSGASWTRVPLYPTVQATAAQIERVSDMLGPVQRMHDIPPSELPMFQGYDKRVVRGSSRPAETLLIKIG
ncbi:DegT/DnrJ/EryC1/StrS family aminotransferase [Nocardia gipuzkoensis]